MPRGFAATTCGAPRREAVGTATIAEGAAATAERALRAEALRADNPEAC